MSTKNFLQVDPEAEPTRLGLRSLSLLVVGLPDYLSS